MPNMIPSKTLTEAQRRDAATLMEAKGILQADAVAIVIQPKKRVRPPTMAELEAWVASKKFASPAK